MLLLADNQAQAKTAATAESDVLRSEEEVALRKQDLPAARSTFSQDAQSLKSKISRSFNEQLAAVEVVPTGKLPEPRATDVPSLADALRKLPTGDRSRPSCRLT